MLMSQRKGLIWLDGKIVPWEEAQVHSLNYTLHYGLGVFEGVRAYSTEAMGTCIFRLEDHTERLFRSAQILNLEVPFTREEINEAQRQIVRKNELSEAYIRPLCFYSSEALGLRAELVPHVMIACWEWPAYIQVPEGGLTLKTSSYTRHLVNSAMCKAKACGHYINSILALREAQDSGCDEAMILDNEGYVCECSGENIFLVRDGQLITPELASCLDGITRATIFTLAEEQGLKIRERRVTRDEVYIADEVFLTGTAAEVIPVQAVDGRHIRNSSKAPITKTLQQLYLDQVRGRLKQRPEWLTPVSKSE